jgi:catechol 2,3-dioxygenase-like lactoylglutathione lyase family enzyme
MTALISIIPARRGAPESVRAPRRGGGKSCRRNRRAPGHRDFSSLDVGRPARLSCHRHLRYRPGMRLTILTILAMVSLAIGPGCKRSERNDPLVEMARECARHGGLSCPRPILYARDLHASQRYYRDALGFKIDWEHGEPPDFGAVSRDDAVLFLCQGCQGSPGSWMMIFTPDVDRLHQEIARKGAIIKSPPDNKPWGMREMQVADPDGNVIRFGSSLDHHD